jgi:hypothetical protein
MISRLPKMSLTIQFHRIPTLLSKKRSWVDASSSLRMSLSLTSDGNSSSSENARSGNSSAPSPELANSRRCSQPHGLKVKARPLPSCVRAARLETLVRGFERGVRLATVSDSGTVVRRKQNASLSYRALAARTFQP